eukprot:4380168-Prymnesium_polylepis.1
MLTVVKFVSARSCRTGSSGFAYEAMLGGGCVACASRESTGTHNVGGGVISRRSCLKMGKVRLKWVISSCFWGSQDVERISSL